MAKAANYSRVFFGILLANIAMVVLVAAVRPLLAQRSPDEPVVSPADVQVPPDDPPSLPVDSKTAVVETTPQSQLLSQGSPLSDAVGDGRSAHETMPSLNPGVGVPSTASAAGSAASDMVLGEILKTIQENREELAIPSIPLPPPSASPKATVELDRLELRLKSIAELTRSAQALLKDARHLESKGDQQAAQAITEHVQTLRTIIVQLAAE